MFNVNNGANSSGYGYLASIGTPLMIGKGGFEYGKLALRGGSGQTGYIDFASSKGLNIYSVSTNYMWLASEVSGGSVGRVAINTSYTLNPYATLEVSGTVKLGYSGEACDTYRAGAIRYVSPTFQVCYGTGGWANLADASSTVATADRITSGTAQVIANGSSNSISITEAGVTTGYYYNGIWVAGGVSTTGTVSATNGYISSSLGIGTTTPSTTLNIMSASPIIRLSDITGLYSSINGSSGNLYYSSYNSTRNHYFMAGATELMRILGTGQVGIGTTTPSATLHVSGSIVIANGSALKGISTDGNPHTLVLQNTGGSVNYYGYLDYLAMQGVNGANYLYPSAAGASTPQIALWANGTNGVSTGTIAPSTTLHVNGAIRMAMDTSTTLNTCDTNRSGAIRYSGSTFQVCYGTGGWANLADASGTTTTADRIISGTAQVIANGNSNSISITEAGVTTGYYYGGKLVAGGVSTTGTVSATNVYATVLQLADSPANTCGPGTYGTMKMINGRQYTCRP
ncbi:hypothetical protein [Mesorhizobium sp. M0019]|uniref:hypothetical protein n=1 Tax=Mesorhizobium sp. M0019 TaxID=2956845 RepID=UPI00333DADE3